MRLFDGDPYSGYERIRRAAPSFWNNISEAQAMWETAGIEHDLIRTAIIHAVNSILIPWAEDAGLKGYEDFFRTEYSGDIEPDIDFRRAMVAAQFTGQRHIGRPEIRQLANRFAKKNDTEVLLDHGNVVVRINAYGGFVDDRAFFKMLKKKLPTHLGMIAELNVVREFRYPVTIGFGAKMNADFPSAVERPVRDSRRRLLAQSGGLSVTKLTGRLITEGG